MPDLFLNNILVSVIIPCYNSESYIQDCIKSVQSQTYYNLEIIVIDDCSIDQSYNIVNEMALSDKRILLIKNDSNRGVSYSRNKGLYFASGMFVCFLDSDDFWLENKVEIQIQAMVNENYNLSYTKFSIFNSSFNKAITFLPPSVNFKQLLYGNCIPLSSVMVKKSSLKNLEFKNIGHEDYLFWLSYLKEGHFAYLINKNLMFHRIHPNSISYNKFKAISYTWNIYRNELSFSFSKSFFYFSIHFVKAIFKHIL